MLNQQLLIKDLIHAENNQIPLIVKYGTYGTHLDVHACGLNDSQTKVLFSFNNQGASNITLEYIDELHMSKDGKFIECSSIDGSGYIDWLADSAMHLYNYYVVNYDGHVAYFNELSEAQACASYASCPDRGGFHDITLSGVIHKPNGVKLYDSFGDWI
jgi:hypothetical protein